MRLCAIVDIHSFVVEAVHGHTSFCVRARARARARKMQNGSVSKQTALRLESQEKPRFSSTCGTVVTLLHDSELVIRQSAVRASSLPPHSLTPYNGLMFHIARRPRRQYSSRLSRCCPMKPHLPPGQRAGTDAVHARTLPARPLLSGKPEGVQYRGLVSWRRALRRRHRQGVKA